MSHYVERSRFTVGKIPYKNTFVRRHQPSFINRYFTVVEISYFCIFIFSMSYSM